MQTDRTPFRLCPRIHPFHPFRALELASAMQHQSRQDHHGERPCCRCEDCAYEAIASICKFHVYLPYSNIIDTSTAKQQQSRTFRARKQIIVSGGTLSSPLILQRSGIGDPKKLKKVGVQPIVDLPGVGLNFQDHYLTFSVFRAKPGMFPSFPTFKSPD